jgi:hypothetical protein
MSQGVYHVFNVAKLRIMEVVYREYPKPVSSKQIAKETGMEQNKVSRLLSHYHSHQYQYFTKNLSSMFSQHSFTSNTPLLA